MAQRFTISSTIKQIFGVGVLTYTLIRFMLVYTTFQEHGLNPLLFLIVDLVSAIPYIIAFPKLIESIVNKQGIFVLYWAFIFSIGLLTPTIFIALTVDGMPITLWFVLGVYISFIIVLAIYRLRKNIRIRKT